MERAQWARELGRGWANHGGKRSRVLCGEYLSRFGVPARDQLVELRLGRFDALGTSAHEGLPSEMRSLSPWAELRRSHMLLVDSE
jgi:hypothetical protein